MWAWILKGIQKLLPFLPLVGGLFEKLTVAGGKAAEIKAKTELVEAQAFKAGRISPNYWRKYIMVALFAVLGIVVIVKVFVTGDISAPLEALRSLMTEGGKMATEGW